MALKVLDIIYFLMLFIAATKSVHLIVFKNNRNGYLFIYLCISLGQESFLEYQSYYNNHHYFYLYNLFDIFCIIFFGVFYYLHTKSRLIIGVGVASLICYFYFCHSIFSNYYDNGGIISSICLLLFSLIDYSYILNSNRIIKITSIPFFWVSTALLLWSVSFLFRLIPRFLFQSADENFMVTLRSFFQFTNVITYSLFYIALIKFEKIKLNEPTS